MGFESAWHSGWILGRRLDLPGLHSSPSLSPCMYTWPYTRLRTFLQWLLSFVWTVPIRAMENHWFSSRLSDLPGLCFSWCSILCCLAVLVLNYSLFEPVYSNSCFLSEIRRMSERCDVDVRCLNMLSWDKVIRSVTINEALCVQIQR